jgi:hypothetical protein
MRSKPRTSVRGRNSAQRSFAALRLAYFANRPYAIRISSIKAFRFQLRLQSMQQRELQRWAGGLRWVWNQALAEQRARHARGEP